MWSPTHVQVLVKRAKGLKIKGKDGTNDAFVTIGIGKEKYQTSVKEKATENVEWCEQCELSIPSHGNTAEIALTALHRNFMGVDEFLGLVSIPLREFDVYDRPRTRWYPLKCKPGQNKNDYRGELEVRVAFTVKAVQNQDHGGSSASIANKNKHKGSLQSLNKAAANLGGSLLNIGSKEKKHLKKFAKSVTHKVEKVGDKAKKSLSKANVNKPDNEFSGGTLPNKFSMENDKYSNRNIDNSLNRHVTDPFSKMKGSRGSGRRMKNQDPGVNSDDEDGLDDDDMFGFDALSHRSSRSSINVAKVDNLGTVSNTSTPLSGSLENIGGGGEVIRKIGTPNMRRGFIHNESPLATPKSSKAGMNDDSTNEPMDEWELKLLGKKGVPFHSANSNNLFEKDKDSFSNSSNQQNRDNLSQISGISFNSGGGLSQSSSRNNTLERKRFQPELPLSVPEETPGGHKKKIIAVGSDFESSPSPEETPSPPSSSRKHPGFDYHHEGGFGDRNEKEQIFVNQTPVGKPASKSQSFNNGAKPNEIDDDSSRNSTEKLTLSQKHKKLVGSKFKNSLSMENLSPISPKDVPRPTEIFRFIGAGISRGGSMFNLNNAVNKGFREKDSGLSPIGNSGMKISNESLTRSGNQDNQSGIHSRTNSVGGSSIGSNNQVSGYPPPPSGPRVVLGRETTPTMGGSGSNQNITNARNGENNPTKIPREVWDRFEGKSREDLIEMIVGLQSSIETQARKQSDLEDYIDSLLTKVLSTAPSLLQKNANQDNQDSLQQMNNKNAKDSLSKQTGKQALFKSFGIKW